ncbi:MAG: hypothetical protein ACLGXA_07015 [Acidobacteriota bacterium]
MNKRLSHNLSALISFTGSKQIDDYSIISNVGHAAGGIQNIYDPRGERAVSSNDISGNLVVSGVYSLPFGRGQTWGDNWNRVVDACGNDRPRDEGTTGRIWSPRGGPGAPCPDISVLLLVAEKCCVFQPKAATASSTILPPARVLSWGI